MRHASKIYFLYLTLCVTLVYVPQKVKASPPEPKSVLELPKSTAEFYDNPFQYWWISPTDFLILRGKQRPQRFKQLAQAKDDFYQWKASRLNITSGKETPLPKLTRLLQKNADFFKVYAADTSANVNSAELLWINSTEHLNRNSADHRYYTYRACTAHISGSDFTGYSIDTCMGFHYAVPAPIRWLPNGREWCQYILCSPSDPLTHQLLNFDTPKPAEREQIEFVIRPVEKRKLIERRRWVHFANHAPGRILWLVFPKKSDKMLVVCAHGDNVKDVRPIGVPLNALRNREKDSPIIDYGFFPYDEADNPQGIAVSPNADRLAWVSEDGHIWTTSLPNNHTDFSAKKLVWTRKNAPLQLVATQLEWSPEGEKLSFAESGHLWIIDSRHFVGE